MKSFLFISILFLSACTSQNSTPENRVVETEEKETFEIIDVREQVLLVQDAKIEVAVALVNSNINDPISVFVIKTSDQKLTYSVTMDSPGKMLPAPSAELLALVEANREGKPDVIDFKIDTKLEQFAITNVLSLGRCLSAPVLPKIIETLSQPRSIIYFALDTLSENSQPMNALRWDMKQKRFSDLVELGSEPKSDIYDEKFVILAPNANLVNSNDEAYLDSAFLDALSFNGECDGFYSSDEKRKPYDQYDPNDRFLPEIDPTQDKFISSLMNQEHQNVNIVFRSALGINWRDDEFPKFKKELIEKAKSNPLFLKFTQGQ